MATYTSQYPPAQSDTYVKATTILGTYYPYFTTDPTKSLTGVYVDNQWLSSALTNQRFHIDLGSAKVIKRIYYENGHYEGGFTDKGAQNFTFWGSNEADDFADLVYINNGTWVSLTVAAPSTFNEHKAEDATDPKYKLVTNAVAYRYYAFKFVDNYGDVSYIGVRRIELQTEVVVEPTYNYYGYNSS